MAICKNYLSLQKTNFVNIAKALFLILTLCNYANCDEHNVIHNLVTNHYKISRNVDETSNGVETETWSDDSVVMDWIRIHVRQMKALVEGGGCIRCCDPLFESIFENHEDINMDIEDIDGGVKVVETGETDCAVDLIQAHAEVVSKFVERGHDEVRRCKQHDAPC